MFGQRCVILIIGMMAALAAGCESRKVSLPAPAAIAEELATDCRFTLDDVEVNADEIVVEPESEREVGVKFRLVLRTTIATACDVSCGFSV